VKMGGPAYGLVTFVRPGGQPEPGLVVGDVVAPLDVPGGVGGLLADWNQVPPRLDAMAERVGAGQVRGVLSLAEVHLRAPVTRPGNSDLSAVPLAGVGSTGRRRDRRRKLCRRGHRRNAQLIR
jgi:hypothetical protein